MDVYEVIGDLYDDLDPWNIDRNDHSLDVDGVHPLDIPRDRLMHITMLRKGLHGILEDEDSGLLEFETVKRLVAVQGLHEGAEKYVSERDRYILCTINRFYNRNTNQKRREE